MTNLPYRGGSRPTLRASTLPGAGVLADCTTTGTASTAMPDTRRRPDGTADRGAGGPKASALEQLVVSEMLGHTDVGVTLNPYSHVTPTLQQQAADALDDLLGDTSAVNLAVNETPDASSTVTELPAIGS